MTKTIIFYAPLGKNTPPEKIGGAEAGCIKTLKIFEEFGYNMIIIDKPANNRNFFTYLIQMLLVPFKICYAIITNKNSIVFIVGFYLHLAFFEYFLVKIANLLNHRVVYEIRNGGMIESYKLGTSFYRFFMNGIFKKSTLVLGQGQEYVNFIRENFNKLVFYYPNYIMDEFMVPNKVERGMITKLIYFGRIAPSKNIDIIIKAFKNVLDAGIESELHLIGGYSDEYKRLLDENISEMGLINQIHFHGRQNFNYIFSFLQNSHYFLFPSSESREGHSNSLTEAMGCGVVPIVSNVGFNLTVCGNAQLVVRDLNPKSYSDKIVEIEHCRSWKDFSNEVYDRVSENYTQHIVSVKLINAIDTLFIDKVV